MSVFQDYYDKEKNFEIRVFWDEGFHVRFGDIINGYITDEKQVWTWEEVEKIFKNKLKEEV